MRTSYLNHLAARITEVRSSKPPITGEQGVVPPHLDGRNATSGNVGPPAAPGHAGPPQLTHVGLNERLGLSRIFADTYTCTLFNQNDPEEDLCTDPPDNDNPSTTLTLEATLTAKDNQTGKTSTTIFTTSGTAYGMCTYFTDCDGDLVSDDYPATASSDNWSEDGGTSFDWQLSYYTIEPSGVCDCDDPDPDGIVWNYNYNVTSTVTFWVGGTGNSSSDCAGLVQILN